MEAQVTGTQRKVLTHTVRPARLEHGSAGIPVRDGKTLSFVVERGWSAPAGTYPEQMFVIDPESREVLYEGPVRETAIWGLQSTTEIVDRVDAPVDLPAGKYAVVFALGSVMGGEFEVEAFEIATETG